MGQGPTIVNGSVSNYSRGLLRWTCLYLLYHFLETWQRRSPSRFFQDPSITWKTAAQILSVLRSPCCVQASQAYGNKIMSAPCFQYVFEKCIDLFFAGGGLRPLSAAPLFSSHPCLRCLHHVCSRGRLCHGGAVSHCTPPQPPHLHALQ